jgi:Helicase associated domain
MAPPSWDERLAEYQRNKKENLRSSGGQRGWECKQRKKYANGTLPDEQEEKLNSVGFEWVATHKYRYDCEAWNKSFKLLETHQSEKGNCRGPFSHTMLDDWVRRQRKALNDANDLNEIYQERRARLNTLGFWGDDEPQEGPPGNVESGLDETARDSHETASVGSQSDHDMGQGPSGSSIDRITATDATVSDG